MPTTMYCFLQCRQIITLFFFLNHITGGTHVLSKISPLHFHPMGILYTQQTTTIVHVQQNSYTMKQVYTPFLTIFTPELARRLKPEETCIFTDTHSEKDGDTTLIQLFATEILVLGYFFKRIPPTYLNTNLLPLLLFFNAKQSQTNGTKHRRQKTSYERYHQHTCYSCLEQTFTLCSDMGRRKSCYINFDGMLGTKCQSVKQLVLYFVWTKYFQDSIQVKHLQSYTLLCF